MALHRDIYWVGKQWAVTGHGIQACNQKQRSGFDIAASRLWEDGVQDAVRALDWVNREDFERAVTVARKHYPEPPRKAPPPPSRPAPPASLTIASSNGTSLCERPELPARVMIEPKAPTVLTGIRMAAAPEPEPLRLVTPTFDMRFEGIPAKMWPVWRIRTR